ncbi:hypothetical protein AB833_23725 [Chromatiales bacterium (ex Bugula neritina AB1)]|nr:hypothetical protein AB833_23725 [Chromatiales bacterium (ex Bugula neritina AB1)]
MALRALAENSVRTDNPGHYTVVSGDTLWDISERFLSRPWLWPEIWHINPQIDNPHLIFPGDEISLTYVDGRPRLQLVRASSKGNAGNAEMATTDLIRTAASTQSNGATSATRTATNVPISNFPIDSIRQFLVEPQVVSKSELKSAPYVVGTEDDRLIASAGNHVYVRGQTDNSRYSVYRAGEPLVDPDTREVLGHEAIHVSKVSLIKSGDPSKMVITSNNRETLVGDRLMSISQSLPLSFQPRMANPGVKGKIINLVNAVSRSGQNQVVVLNLGSSDGVQAGDVMSIISDDRRIKDTVSGKKNDYVTVKGDESGAVMVFRTFDRVSYALIMKSNRAIRLYDRVAVTDL